MKRSKALFAGFAATVFLIASCSTNRQAFAPGNRMIQEYEEDIAKPASNDPVLAWQSFDRTAVVQGEQLLDFDRNFRKLVNRPKQSYNINTFDEVPNSSWFTNRQGTHVLTPEEIMKGVSGTDGPDTSGDWIVFRPKVQGATPGFWIEDCRGDRYIIKFDPPSNPELATAAAAMASRYFHASGYNVPQETIIHWRPDRLKVKDGVEFTDRTGIRRVFTDDDLNEILQRVHHESDGSIRSLASLVLKGDILGPFSYDDRRKDDPNDWCPHEHRRELRSLYVVASLINHYDAKDQNSLDVFVEEDGKNFVKHYLIDFGSTFGANGDRPKGPIQGYANSLDLRDVFVSFVTLGLKTWPWEHAEPIQYASIGYFESEIFEPNKFDPIVPNPAFENMTERDAYWAAKIVMAFLDEHLKALVKTGEFTDPAAEEYLFRTLVERRDKIGEYWFSKVNPLENFELSNDESGLMISFLDLARHYGLSSEQATHSVEVYYRGKKVIVNRSFTSDEIRFDSTDLQAMTGVYRSPNSDDVMSYHLYEIRIRSSHNRGHLSRPVILWLWYTPESSKFELVGIEHLDR